MLSKLLVKKFKIRVQFNCESKDLIYVVICSRCKEKYIRQTQAIFKERLNTHRQYIRQPDLQQIGVEGHTRTRGGRNFKIMLFFAFWEDKNNLKRII